MKKVSLLIMTSLLGLAACAPSKKAASNNKIEVENSCTSGIVGGKSVKNEDPLSKKVVLLMMADKENKFSTCTGTPIADNVILTAAHCVKDAVLISAIFKTSLCEGTQLKKEEVIPAIDWKKHSDYKDLGSSDVAIVKLESSIPADYEVSKIYDGSSDITSKTVTLIGYGRTSENDESLPKLRKTYKILNEEIGHNEKTGDLLVIDQKTTGVCFGDSGGPVFVEVDSELQIAGVNSFVLNPDDQNKKCHYAGAATYMPPYRTWLSEVTGLNFN
jgi:secreted trypsin-like serine protease